MNPYKMSIIRHPLRFRMPPTLAGLLAAWLAASAFAAVAPDTGSESREVIRAAAERLIRSQLSGATQNIYVHAADPDARLHLAHCSAPLSASLLAGVQLGARSEVRVSCTAQGTPWAIYVPVSIESDVNVLVLREGVIRGARVTPEQVVTETRHVSGLPVGYVTDANGLQHYTLARSAPPGTALTADLMVADFVVRRGQDVTLVAQGPGISVRATGKALEDGREGGQVRVQNLASQKVVQGVVDGNGTIQVTP
jgi:flagellar basal body P-ring formation protein FlgA